MKKLFIISIGALLVNTASSQDLTIRTHLDTNGVLCDSKIINISGKTKEAVYTSVLDWIVEADLNAEGTLQSIVGEEFVGLRSVLPRAVRIDPKEIYNLNFVTGIEVKDGYLLFKVSHINIYGIKHSPYGNSPYRKTFERAVLHPNAMVKTAKRPRKIRTVVEKSLSNYLSSLVAHINNGDNGE